MNTDPSVHQEPDTPDIKKQRITETNLVPNKKLIIPIDREGHAITNKFDPQPLQAPRNERS